MKKKNFLKCICLNKNPQVRHLDYSSRYLRQVPPEIFNHERTLESLSLDNNNITELTKELFCCKALRELVLSDNELTHIPDAIGNLANLTSLNVSKNNLQELPDKLASCAQLTFLDASGNVFEELPEGLCHMAMLQELIANTAFLTGLPQNIGRLVNLRHLEIRENDIKALPAHIGYLSNLQYLDVGHNDLKELPDSLCQLSQLAVLSADKNSLGTLPEKIGSCASLQVLELQQNCLTFVPDSVCHCQLLTELIVSCNQLQALPGMLGQLSKLTNLRVDNNQLSRLPDSIGQLESLVQLYASSNNLVHLPPSIGLLRRLRDLHLDMNLISELPIEIGSCSALTVLSLRGNKIQYLPDEIGRIPRLRMINLSNNRVKFLPISFLKLRELQAVWFNDNQIQPLVQLQSERDVDTGRKCLMCYLLPQMSNTDDPDAVDNDPSAWQVVQDSRPRVVQWNDEATGDAVNGRGKLPKDAPAKQVNLGKHSLAKQHGSSKPASCSASSSVSAANAAALRGSHPVSLGNGDCIMVPAATLSQHPEVAGFVGSQHKMLWHGNMFYSQPQQGLPSFYQALPHNGSLQYRAGVRRGGSGYESDSVALQASRARGRFGHMMMAAGGSGTADRVLGQIHESAFEAGGHHSSLQSGGGNADGPGGHGVNQNRQALQSANALRYGVHATGGGMVGGRQSGYSTDTGLVMSAGRKENRLGHRMRHAPKGSGVHTHFKNPYDQLRIMRSSTPVSRRPDSVTATTISSLPPAPQRQPPPPPQRPLPSPPFRGSSAAPLTNAEWQLQMAAAASGGAALEQVRMLPGPGVAPLFTACPGGPEDARGGVGGGSAAANMIIPPPPCRTPPGLSQQQHQLQQLQQQQQQQQHHHHRGLYGSPGLLGSPTEPAGHSLFHSHQPAAAATTTMVDLLHPGLASISPSLIDEPAAVAAANQHQSHSNHHPVVPAGAFCVKVVNVSIQRNKGLGFSITGGVTSNPNLFRPADKGVFIAKVNPGGPADGQLKVGDKILVVNNSTFIGIDHATAVSTLKNCGDMVQMIIDRLVEVGSDI